MIPRRGGRGGCFAAGRCGVPARGDRGPIWWGRAASGLAWPIPPAGRYQCTGNGAIPATLAEYDTNAWDGLDFYDVSMVDGSNLSK
jgi:hypothetical protein